MASLMNFIKYSGFRWPDSLLTLSRNGAIIPPKYPSSFWRAIPHPSQNMDRTILEWSPYSTVIERSLLISSSITFTHMFIFLNISSDLCLIDGLMNIWLFLINVEQEIGGIRYADQNISILAYAYDIRLFILNNWQRIKAWKMINTFCWISGMVLNFKSSNWILNYQIL